MPRCATVTKGLSWVGSHGRPEKGSSDHDGQEARQLFVTEMQFWWKEQQGQRPCDAHKLASEELLKTFSLLCNPMTFAMRSKSLLETF